MSAFESDLTYFRFDGTRYRRVGTATRVNNDGEKAVIYPGHQ